jgi:hypothetical protein
MHVTTGRASAREHPPFIYTMRAIISIYRARLNSKGSLSSGFHPFFESSLSSKIWKIGPKDGVGGSFCASPPRILECPA